jgi:hypothetical protein
MTELVRRGKAASLHLVASDGGVFSYNAPFFGSMGEKHLNAPMVGITVAG